MATETAEEFRQKQQEEAAKQNLRSENAVPEQRPIASQTTAGTEGVVAKRLREGGHLNDEPMPKSAYDRAESEAQAKKAAKKERVPNLHPGHRVRITAGPYEGSFGAITRVNYANVKEAALGRSGDPAEGRFAKVDTYEIRTRGGRHDLVNAAPDAVELVEIEDYGRGPA